MQVTGITEDTTIEGEQQPLTLTPTAEATMMHGLNRTEWLVALDGIPGDPARAFVFAHSVTPAGYHLVQIWEPGFAGESIRVETENEDVKIWTATWGLLSVTRHR